MTLMENTNYTTVNGFVLLGLSRVPYLQGPFFFLFLTMYVTTVLGNMLLIIAVKLNTQLQTPMYFFLCNLAFIDICFSSTTVPQMLINTLRRHKNISLLGCAAQMYFSLALGATECLILAIMAFDRYAAICKPLHYNTIMNNRVCIALSSSCWSFCFINSTVHVALTFQLPFCWSHLVNHFFCEMPPFFRLSCRDTWLNEVAMYTSAVIIVLCSLLLTLSSYVHIITTILAIRSSRKRHKAFSTCTSHLIVITVFYSTIMFTYLQPHSTYSPETNKKVSVLYAAVIPMFNPIVYSVRNQGVKETLKRLLTTKNRY
ncbi:olfactory receptor 1019-like [Spea bombifrons]|uniref:olfactory receptor 1019-like n=1 Tax=Spea bombifrons TaxID=233779 RepID=UPI00234B115E|nr:olfactory receptor 1019-like [Spea bombifrons]